MPTTRADALGAVAAYAEASRHVHRGSIESFTDRHGADCRGYRFATSDADPYLVYGPASGEYLYVTAHHSPVQALAHELDDDDVDDYRSRDVAYDEGDDDPRHIAARAVLDEADGMAEAAAAIREECDTAAVVYEPHRTRHGALSEFYFHRRLYPGGRFDREDIDDAVRAVTDAVERAYTAYYRILDIPVLDENAGGEPAARPDYVSGGRGFQ